MAPKSHKTQLILISAGLILLIGAAFEPLQHNDFVDYDDNAYLFENTHILSGLTWPSITWAFTSGYAANWHPLTWLSHMLDVTLFGLNPLGHHLHNLLLHAINTVLLFWLFYKMTGTVWRMAFMAAVFGIHPLRVESVAWAAERKDVLGMLFFILTLIVYFNYVKRGGIGRYLLVLLCFALGLMAKPMLVTLPIVLLLLDYWPLERYRPDVVDASAHNIHSWKPWSRLLTEKIPLLLLTLISCVITFLVQQHGGSVTTSKFPIRILNALFGYMEYLCKFFWPRNLAMLYPYPNTVYPLWPPTIAAIVLVLITIFVVYRSFQKPYWIVGWAWYLVTLLPVIGLIQVGSQTTADRYSYLPSIGIILPLSWIISEFAAKRPIYRWIIGVMAMACITAMLLSTRIQVTYWKNSETLFSHTLAVTQDNYIIHNNLGFVYLKQKRFPEAMEQIAKSLAIRPDYLEARLSMAFLYIANKQLDNASDYLHKILEDYPHNASALFNIGMILEVQNHTEEALRYYEQASRSDRNHFKALGRAGLIYMRQGNWDKAAKCFQQSLSINPAYPEARQGLDKCLNQHHSTQ
jgi:hypothetical protein